ncbi:hypothetical protein CP532_5272 [Ophiocordyceps camponoti-leonardi (nom. inval.)]|nr:hypothetical protein CP532_5272 [Ophiocordyceps camponoti-leonardi (nom. inval.)]
MRLGESLFFFLLLSLLSIITPISATPFLHHRRGGGGGGSCNGTPCGAQGQFCCGADEACTTLAGNVATCVAGSLGGGAYTTTWTETRTYTSTIMTHWLPAPEPTAGVDCSPAAPDQQACGPICCAGWQTCAFRGQCSVKPGFVEPTPVVVTADGGQLTTQYSAPFRVTGTTTVTTSGAAGPPSSSSSSATAAAEAIGADTGTAGSGLSPGAIAGIVIGTVVGVALLLLLCFCCIARGLWATICGSGRRKDRERVEVYEERRSRRTSRAPSAAYAVRKDRHSGWFGGPSRPASVVDRREKRSGGNAWLAIAGAGATILALLNLKKKEKPKPKPSPPRKVGSSRDSYSYYDYDYSDLTGPSSSSSGRRTNYTRRTGDSRMPGPSHYSRSSRRP